jgi:hypothetical protein
VNLTSSLCVASSESGPPPGSCRVCQRKGLPILVLREALVPKPASWLDPPRPPAEPAIAEMQKGCRILRAGYLYVLLNYSVWQAYQVSPDGYLRQFNPCAPPLADGQPLARACVQSDHDMPASLLNLDVDTYHTAALAFSDDPWPVSVLDHYKSGCNVARLQTIDLATARDTPNEIGDFLTAENTKVYDEVYEYAEFVPRFNSVHPFHTRGYRRQAMGNFLRKAPTCGSLGPGVLAIVLKDSVGLVQEYNGLRAQWAHARQVWLEEPERAYQHQTSQILLTIRALHRQWANAKVPTVPPTLPEGHFTTEHWKERRRGHVESEAVNSDKRLEERYDEPKRAAFQADYDYQLTAYQKQIDHYAALYAEVFASPEFQYAMQHDYDGDDSSSGMAYSKTMSLCLRGGISEAADNETGPTAQMWQKMLQDPHGPVYQALLMRDKHLLAGLLPTFSDTGATNWNDSNKLYTVLTKAITSDEARHFMRPHLQESIAQVLAALNGASARLINSLSPGVGQAVSRLNSASQLLYNGIHLVEVQVRMKLGEYHALQSAHVHSLEQRLANTADRPNDRPKVVPLIMGGLPRRSVLDPKIANLRINVSVWVQGSLDDIKSILKGGVTSEWLGSDAPGRSSLLIVGTGTLDPEVKKILGQVKVSPQQAQTIVNKGFSGLSGISKSLELLVAIGSLYLLNDSMKKNINAIEFAAGENALDVKILLHGSILALIGGGFELIGTGVKLSTKLYHRSSRSEIANVNHSKRAMQIGKLLTNAGALATAISTFYEATVAALRVRRSLEAGESKTAVIYALSAGVLGGAGLTGVYSAAMGLSALMGPLGAFIILGLIGYGLFKWAESRESTQIEQWVKRCYFGLSNENPKIHWETSLSSSAAMLELNAIILGVELNILTRHIYTDDISMAGSYWRTGAQATTPHWEYRIILPNYDENLSAYFWQFTVHYSDRDPCLSSVEGEIVAAGAHGQRGMPTPAGDLYALSTRSIGKSQPYYKTQIASTEIFKIDASDTERSYQLLSIIGSFELIRSDVPNPIKEVSLSLTYWPDLNFKNDCAEKVWRKKTLPD